MTDEQRRPRPAAQYGPTAHTVADNVQRLRKRREMSIYELSGQLRKAGRPITPAAVGKIERSQRQVTVDDLIALAVILGVSPSALLMPFTEGPDAPVEVTGRGVVPAQAAWEWADGRAPIGWDPRRPADDQYREWMLFGWPAWLRPFRDEPAAYRSDQYERRGTRGAVAFTEDGHPIWIYPDSGGDGDGPGVD